MYTISMQDTPDGTVRIWACQWYRAQRYPQVIFDVEYQRTRPTPNADLALDELARLAQDFLSRKAEWDSRTLF